MPLRDEDYLKLLHKSEYYLQCKLQFEGMQFPPCKLGDIRPCFNHYTRIDEAEEKWYKRVESLKWDNLFIMIWWSCFLRERLIIADIMFDRN